MKKKYIIFLIFVLMSFILNTGCKEIFGGDEKDEKELDPYSSKPTPLITDITPDSSYSGIGIITITGQNFSTDLSENTVFFNGNKGVILSASTTQLEIQVPVLVEDSIFVQIYVKGAYLYGEYGGSSSTDTPFKLKDALLKFKSVSSTIIIGGLAIDQNENIYTILESPQGIVQITNPDSTNLPQYSNSPTGVGLGMKIGPGGYLYFARKNKNIYRVPPGGGSFEIFGKVGENCLDLDFDENLNMFAAGKEGKVFRISPAADTMLVARHGVDYDITIMRVYDGYLYSVLDYIGTDTTTVFQRGIVRNQIVDATGTLGANEEVFNWDNYVGASGPNIMAMVIDENGILYLGNDYVGNDNNEAITMLDVNTGSTEALYPSILTPGAYNLCWGNTNYLYIHHYDIKVSGETSTKTRELLRLSMPVNSAPYYGRQ